MIVAAGANGATDARGTTASVRCHRQRPPDAVVSADNGIGVGGRGKLATVVDVLKNDTKKLADVRKCHSESHCTHNRATRRVMSTATGGRSDAVGLCHHRHQGASNSSHLMMMIPTVCSLPVRRLRARVCT